MTCATDFVELEVMRRLHNEALGELKSVEDQEVPSDPAEAEVVLGRAIRLRARVKVLDDAIRARAARLGVRIAGEEPPTPTVH